MKPTILVAHHDPEIIAQLEKLLSPGAQHVLSATSAEKAIRTLRICKAEIVVIDSELFSDQDGHYSKILANSHPQALHLVITPELHAASAFSCADDTNVFRFFSEPCTAREIALGIREAIKHYKLLAEMRRLKKIVESQRETIEDLERDNPGISAIRRAVNGAILVAEEDSEAVLKEIEASGAGN